MKNLFIRGGILGGLLFLFLLPNFCSAQSGLAMTITPPLIKNNVNPGQIWKSAVKVVNNNTREIDIYLQVMDFKGGTDSGTVNFITNTEGSEEESKYLLSTWINIDPGPVTLGPNESKEIPFLVVVPEDASPGGHYAAILAGTKPPTDKLEGSAIKVSSLISSLLLLTIKGDIIEDGKIRDFSTEKYINKDPDINFEVKFENNGNVHMQPQGEIRVFDMYGKDQGRMTLNHGSEFGNVLPGETRKWNFNWQGDDSLWSMGRYRASLVIGFGDQAYQTDTRELYFWVLDFVLLSIVGGLVLFIIFLVVISIRFYVRRAIRMTQSQVESLGLPKTENNRLRIRVDENGGGVVDLKQKAKPEKMPAQNNSLNKKQKTGFSLWRSLFKFFILIFFVAIIIFAVLFYINYKKTEAPDNQNTQTEESVKEEVDNQEDNKKISNPEEESASSSSELEIEEKEAQEEAEIEKEDISIVILNGNGQPGVAGKARDEIEKNDFLVERLGNADNFQYDKTIIRYKKNMKEFAEEIKEVLKVQAELEENNQLEEEILVVLGADY